MPFELRPYPNETLKPEGEYLQNAWKNGVYPTAERFGVKMELPRVSPQPHTHLAFEGFQYAKEHGKANEYNHRVMAAFFQESRDIGNVEVLASLAGDVGLDVEEFRQALVNRSYKDAHQRLLRHAYEEARITAVPTFVIGDRALPGLYGKETLERVIAEAMQKQGDIPADGMACGIDGCD